MARGLIKPIRSKWRLKHVQRETENGGETEHQESGSGREEKKDNFSPPQGDTNGSRQTRS
jgi:hypothetical protein